MKKTITWFFSFVFLLGALTSCVQQDISEKTSESPKNPLDVAMEKVNSFDYVKKIEGIEYLLKNDKKAGVDAAYDFISNLDLNESDFWDLDLDGEYLYNLLITVMSEGYPDADKIFIDKICTSQYTWSFPYNGNMYRNKIYEYLRYPGLFRIFAGPLIEGKWFEKAVSLDSNSDTVEYLLSDFIKIYLNSIEDNYKSNSHTNLSPENYTDCLNNVLNSFHYIYEEITIPAAEASNISPYNFQWDIPIFSIPIKTDLSNPSINQQISIDDEGKYLIISTKDLFNEHETTGRVLLGVQFKLPICNQPMYMEDVTHLILINTEFEYRGKSYLGIDTKGYTAISDIYIQNVLTHDMIYKVGTVESPPPASFFYSDSPPKEIYATVDYDKILELIKNSVLN